MACDELIPCKFNLDLPHWVGQSQPFQMAAALRYAERIALATLSLSEFALPNIAVSQILALTCIAPQLHRDKLEGAEKCSGRFQAHQADSLVKWP